MNLKKALKEKNKLKGKISDTFDKLRRYNLTTEGTEKTYSTHQASQNSITFFCYLLFFNNSRDIFVPTVYNIIL